MNERVCLYIYCEGKEERKVMMREVWVGGTGKRTWQVQLVRERN